MNLTLRKKSGKYNQNLNKSQVNIFYPDAPGSKTNRIKYVYKIQIFYHKLVFFLTINLKTSMNFFF